MVCLLGLLSFAPFLSAAARLIEDSWYEVYLRGVKEGFLHRKVTDVVQGEKKIRLIELTAELEAKVLFNNSFNLVSEEKAAIDEDGIYQYHGIFKYGRVTLEISGQRQGDVFRIEEKQENKPVRVYKVKRDKYDISSIELGAGRLVRQGEEKTLRVLSFYSLNITEEILKWDKDKEQKIDGAETLCKVVRFWVHGADGKRYYAKDNEKLMVREAGKSKDGKYYLQLSTEEQAKSWSKGNPYQ